MICGCSCATPLSGPRHYDDYERLAATLAGLYFLAFACRMLHQFTHLISRP